MNKGSANPFLLMTNSDDAARTKPPLRPNLCSINDFVVYDQLFKLTHISLELAMLRKHLGDSLKWVKVYCISYWVLVNSTYIGLYIAGKVRPGLSFLSDTSLNTSKGQSEGKSHTICFAIKCCSEEVGAKKKRCLKVLVLTFKYLGQRNIVTLGVNAVNSFFGGFLHLTTTS